MPKVKTQDEEKKKKVTVKSQCHSTRTRVVPVLPYQSVNSRLTQSIGTRFAGSVDLHDTYSRPARARGKADPHKKPREYYAYRIGANRSPGLLFFRNLRWGGTLFERGFYSRGGSIVSHVS